MDDLKERLRRRVKYPNGTRRPSPRELEAADLIEELEARLAKAEAERDAIEAEMKRRNDNERRNCINWGPCSEHDEQGNRP